MGEPHPRLHPDPRRAVAAQARRRLPNYQSAENVPRSLCEVTGVALRPEDGWDLDTDAIAAALRPTTRLIAVNFPNNPTGSVASPGQWRALVDLARDRGIYLFSDEIYRGVERDPARTLPQAADEYERAISLGGLSKAYGLPGLRIGWIACRDPDVLDRAERVKHYGSICSAAPSEVLARIALKARDTLLAGTREVIAANLPHFASPLVTLPDDRFRVGIGRVDAPQGLAALEDFLGRRA